LDGDGDALLWLYVLIAAFVSWAAARVFARGRESSMVESKNNPKMLTKVLIVAALALLVGIAIYAKQHKRAGEVTAANETAVAIPKLIDLGSETCVPCKLMAPILDELKMEYAGRFDVIFIDVWKDRSAGPKHGVRVIPTQIFFDAEGKELFRHEGFFSREDILGKWQELGFVF
jgi:thioredoxin 1